MRALSPEGKRSIVELPKFLQLSINFVVKKRPKDRNTRAGHDAKSTTRHGRRSRSGARARPARLPDSVSGALARVRDKKSKNPQTETRCAGAEGKHGSSKRCRSKCRTSRAAGTSSRAAHCQKQPVNKSKGLEKQARGRKMMQQGKSRGLEKAKKTAEKKESSGHAGWCAELLLIRNCFLTSRFWTRQVKNDSTCQSRPPQRESVLHVIANHERYLHAVEREVRYLFFCSGMRFSLLISPLAFSYVGR